MKKCPTGKYYCTKREKCMPIPHGYHIGYRGWLEPDEDGNGNGKKSKGGKKNGNGSSGSNGSHNGSGNGNGNGGNGGNGGGAVSESSLNRIRQKDKKGGMAIISAARGDKSKKENKKRDTALGKRFPGSTRVKGKYTEKDTKTGKETTVSEPSRVVTSGKLGKRKFAKKVKKAGKDFDQDSVLIKKKGTGSAKLHGTTKGAWPGRGKKVTAGKMKPGRSSEHGHSEVKGKKFTYEATTLPRVNGQTMYVTFQWRGKYMSLQMFFPEMKVPSKKDVQAAVVKVYPGARVMNYDVVLRDPTKPILQLPEDTNPPADTPDKEPNKDQKEKELKNKERRLSMIKRMVLLKKMQAVRQGGGSDIIA